MTTPKLTSFAPPQGGAQPAWERPGAGCGAMTAADWIADSARRTPDKVALRHGPEALSYAALAAQCEQIAAALAAQGLASGGCVAWLGLNSPRMLATLFACARLGAIFMPLNWRLAPPEHAAMLRDCTPALLVVDENFAAASGAQRIAPATTRCIAFGAAPPGWM